MNVDNRIGRAFVGARWAGGANRAGSTRVSQRQPDSVPPLSPCCWPPCSAMNANYWYCKDIKIFNLLVVDTVTYDCHIFYSSLLVSFVRYSKRCAVFIFKSNCDKRQLTFSFIFSLTNLCSTQSKLLRYKKIFQ